MKIYSSISAVFMFIAVITTSFADEIVESSMPAKPLSFTEQTARAFKQVDEADFVAWYSMDAKVVIQQAYGNGRGIHLEHVAKPRAEQDGADQPAAAPESSDPFSSEPQPKSKGRSQ